MCGLRGVLSRHSFSPFDSTVSARGGHKMGIAAKDGVSAQLGIHLWCKLSVDAHKWTILCKAYPNKHSYL